MRQDKCTKTARRVWRQRLRAGKKERGRKKKSNDKRGAKGKGLACGGVQDETQKETIRRRGMMRLLRAGREEECMQCTKRGLVHRRGEEKEKGKVDSEKIESKGRKV